MATRALKALLVVLLSACATHAEDSSDAESNLNKNPGTSPAAECELESVQSALMNAVASWNNDGDAIGTTFKATAVKLKPKSEGVQGTFINTVSLSIYEAGRGSTFETSIDVPVQKILNTCSSPTVPTRDGIATFGVGDDGNAAPCPLQSTAAALVQTIDEWNLDGAAIGTSFKATKVTTKPGSSGIQGTFTSTVSLEIFEAGRDSTFETSIDVPMQNIANRCVDHLEE